MKKEVKNIGSFIKILLKKLYMTLKIISYKLIILFKNLKEQIKKCIKELKYYK